MVVTLLFCFAFSVGATEDSKKASQMYRQFRMLYDKGDDSAFYQHAHAFEEYLKSTNDWKSYYKTKTNEGFYDIKQKHLFRAIVTAQYLDADARKNKDVEYYYLATVLMGNIYRASHDTRRAEEYFVQALNEVDDRDPKFTMVTLRDLAQLLCIKEPARAIETRQGYRIRHAGGTACSEEGGHGQPLAFEGHQTVCPVPQWRQGGFREHLSGV